MNVAKVWASYDSNGKRNSADYWVIHNSDGAGIEASSIIEN